MYFSRRLPVWLLPAENLRYCNQATSCLSLRDTGRHCKKFLDLPWVLTIMWPQKLVTFSFLMWVKCGAQ